MTPDSTNNDEGPKPAKKKPRTKSAAVEKEVSEMDLWDLDEQESPENPDQGSAPPRLEPTPRKARVHRLQKNETPSFKEVEAEPPLPAEPKRKFRAEKKKDPFTVQATRPGKTKLTPDEVMADLPAEEQTSEIAEDEKKPVAEIVVPEKISFEKTTVEEPEGISEEENEPIQASTEEEEEEAVEPASEIETYTGPVLTGKEALSDLRKRYNLTKGEKIGFGALLLCLLGGVLFFLTNAIYGLPKEPQLLGSQGFPVRGKYLTILAAETYWRPPITEGTNADAVRMGTKLLPVIKVQASEGKGAIRVFFRNSRNELIGDEKTRSISSGATLDIPATAGFEELGMYAAYRTGEDKPWKVEVFEGPSYEAPSTQFTKLYEAHIATETR